MVFKPSSIMINPGGSMANFGTVSNLAVVFIYQGATLTNHGVINDECGGTTTGAGTVSGTPPVNLCGATTGVSSEPSSFTAGSEHH
jgi:hypothetical protein